MTRPLAQVLAGLRAPRLVVVGDLILDRYLTGAVERISPEAPIQVLRVEDENQRLGGAGSVAINVAVLGAATTLVGVTGDDGAARMLASLAAEAGITYRGIALPGRRTSVKTRHLAHSHSTAQQVLRVDEESVEPLSGAESDELIAVLDAALQEADAVLVSDYGKGCITEGLLRFAIDRARAASIPVVVDPKGDDFTPYRGATTVTPNRPETQRATGLAVPDVAAAEAAATRLQEDLALDFALLTLDREGMYLKAAGAAGVHLPTTPREVFDVTGAGDMVVSVLGLALASGAVPLEAAALANVAAGLEVERVGVVPVTRDELAARIATEGNGETSKLVPPAELGAVVARHRAARRRIVFTNGCFDILHAGHVRYLREARSHGDVLIVGLNADASVRRLKGQDRPINPQADRVEVLAALAMVDYVVLFDEDTPLALIEAVQPDVLVKGMDWKDKGVVGREVVEARGGQVVLVDLLEGRSTSGLVERLRDPGA